MNYLKTACEIWSDFVLNIFPAICINCNSTLVRDEQFICSKCKLSLPRTNDHLDPTNRRYQKFAYEPKITHVSSFLDYNRQGVARKLIHAIKYRGETELAILLGRMYGIDLVSCAQLKPDFIVPVPLHPRKQAKRGFNQSEIISMGISEVIGVPVESDIVRRNTFTATQTKKSKVNRWENVGNVFEVSNPQRLEGKNIMIVDDVLTTGATLGSLATQIANCGGKEVYLISLAGGA
ncbi:MAG: ComF family protein [Bacteroidota bacterium]